MKKILQIGLYLLIITLPSFLFAQETVEKIDVNDTNNVWFCESFQDEFSQLLKDSVLYIMDSNYSFITCRVYDTYNKPLPGAVVRFIGEYSKKKGMNIQQNGEGNVRLPQEFYKIVVSFPSKNNFELDCVEIKDGQRRLFEFMLGDGIRMPVW